MLTTSLLPWTFSLSYSYHRSLTRHRSWQPVWFFALSLLFPSCFLLFSILLLYLDLISTILSLIIFYTILAWLLSIHFFWQIFSPKCSVSLKSNPDSWVSLKMILQPHMLMPKLNEPSFPPIFSPSELFPLSSSLLFCCVHDWLI